MSTNAAASVIRPCNVTVYRMSGGKINTVLRRLATLRHSSVGTLTTALHYTAVFQQQQYTATPIHVHVALLLLSHDSCCANCCSCNDEQSAAASIRKNRFTTTHTRPAYCQPLADAAPCPRERGSEQQTGCVKLLLIVGRASS